MGNLIDMSGKRVGHLLIVGRVPSKGKRGAAWHVRCDCGVETTKLGIHLRSGLKSCGHGRQRRGSRTEYIVWRDMIRRCTTDKHNSYRWYGARGISVCTRWQTSFTDFLTDMGRRPSPAHSIDRINNDGNYEPGNCRWATAKEQRANQRKPLTRVREAMGGLSR